MLKTSFYSVHFQVLTNAASFIAFKVECHIQALSSEGLVYNIVPNFILYKRDVLKYHFHFASCRRPCGVQCTVFSERTLD